MTPVSQGSRFAAVACPQSQNPGEGHPESGASWGFVFPANQQRHVTTATVRLLNFVVHLESSERVRWRVRLLAFEFLQSRLLGNLRIPRHAHVEATRDPLPGEHRQRLASARMAAGKALHAYLPGRSVQLGTFCHRDRNGLQPIRRQYSWPRRSRAVPGRQS